jgi:hypothetical protein
MKFIVVLLLASFSALAADLKIKDFNWNMTDIASRGLTKEALYSRMDRDFVKPGSSICSNRALMWANDFKQKNNLDTGKIFLFYTKKKGAVSLKTWWYHVAPVINEGGKAWIMDAGFPGWFNQPLTKEEWLLKFTTSTNCKEINSNENELIELIFQGQVFPHESSYGNFDCYYKLAPDAVWTPEILAQSILGTDQRGTPVRIDYSTIDNDQLYQACLEATSSAFGYAFGASKEQCKAYVGR